MLKFYDITGNEHALQHIINQLEEGRTLSAKVRTNVDFRRGALLAALPENIKPSPSLNFAECLPLRFEPNYLPDVAAIIKEFIVGHIHAVLIQDDLSSTQDEELQAYLGQNHALCYKDEVYWQLVGPDVSDED